MTCYTLRVFVKLLYAAKVAIKAHTKPGTFSGTAGSKHTWGIQPEAGNILARST